MSDETRTSGMTEPQQHNLTMRRAARGGSRRFCSHARLAVVVAGCVLGTWVLGACDSLTKSDQLPPEVTDPAITQTPAGALAAYYGALAAFQGAISNGEANNNFVVVTGMLADELTVRDIAAAGVDLRKLDDSPTGFQPANLFQSLNGVRQRARQAIGLLTDYRAADSALRAHLYAVEGYADVMLAELYCSGIPLSTVDYKGDYTLKPGSSTAEVFTQAAALFDSALALAGDSVRILNLSRVGQARARLGLGDYTQAAAAVAAVPDSFQYALHYGTDESNGGFGFVGYPRKSVWFDAVTVADREGQNGLDYRTSNDPRTRMTLLDNGVYHPDKYPLTGADTLLLASGLEARLAEAEAALHAGGDWLGILNALRTNGTQDGTGAYNPGTGGVAGLAPLQDPGAALATTDADTARVRLLFRERAFWLFLTGHRQGDMRRLVRQYKNEGFAQAFAQDKVYPIGTSAVGIGYGTNIDLPVPWDERTLNPSYTGCISRD